MIHLYFYQSLCFSCVFRYIRFHLLSVSGPRTMLQYTYTITNDKFSVNFGLRNCSAFRLRNRKTMFKSILLDKNSTTKFPNLVNTSLPFGSYLSRLASSYIPPAHTWAEDVALQSDFSFVRSIDGSFKFHRGLSIRM